MTAQTRRTATLAGGFSVLVWGCALPIVKSVEDQIGLLAFLGSSFTVMATFGAIRHFLKREAFDWKIFRNSLLYLRWICFVLHEGLLAAALALVQREHMPLVILLNYLWPTVIILCSILFGTVTVTRWSRVSIGSFLVLSSICFEVLGPHPSTTGLFRSTTDCLAYLFVFIGAVSWGFYSVLSGRFGEQTGGAGVLSIFQATLGLAILFAFHQKASPWHHVTPGTIALLATYCFLLFVAYLTWDKGMRFGNIVLLSLFADLIPWLSLITASVILQIAIPARVVVAAVVLVAGAIITRMGTKRSPVFEQREP